MKRILFSAVGGTDPISGQHDGAILHIARCYDLDKIYLFISEEMRVLDKRDNRYVYCLNKLKESTGKKFEVEKITNPELKDVHVFDVVLEEFKNQINDILKKEGEECELLLNVSSGTPAMKSALQIYATIAERKVIPIQVSTPSKSYNERREEVKGDYNVELQWEMNLDNAPGFTGRCTESEFVNLNAEIKKNIIKKMLAVYDYVGASEVAADMGTFLDKQIIYLIQAAESRLQLDKSRSMSYLKETGYKMFPHESSDECAIFEQLILCRIKIARHEYADFLRSISPLYFAVMERIITVKLGIKLNACYNQKKGLNGTFFKSWNLKRVENDKALKRALTGAGERELPDRKVVTTEDLVQIIIDNSEDKVLNELVLKLRDIEKGIRNPIAHCITYMTEDVIKDATGVPAEKIFDMLKDLTIASGIKVTPEDLLTYEKTNEEIIKHL